ncbi:speckle-type POZ protein-like A [Paramacrobiotus metropolitanus]|uniref:speckle-type POZ protein-like A n=1 Tax=Paramacrobiotus metropolitanus TaxID=2943436 RepID=UPI002446173F|nr:speckle-type POZ protein-like A [Paramacrobiotus metropolitanus]
MEQTRNSTVHERVSRDSVPFTLKLTIDCFKSFKNRKETFLSEGITSSELGTDSDYQGRWRVRVETCFKETVADLESKYVSVYLSFTDTDKEAKTYTGGHSVDAQFKISVYTGKEMDVLLKASSASYTFSNAIRGGYGFSKFFPYAELFDGAILKDDSVTVVLDVVVYQPPKLARLSDGIIAKPFESNGKLLLNFATRQNLLLSSGQPAQSTDFVLHSGDGKQFSVSRSFLAAQSPVFSAMFKHNCKENQIARCDLKDVDGESVGILLDYVYGCKFGQINQRNAERVLIMADKYEMLDLRAVCEQILASNIPLRRLHIISS